MHLANWVYEEDEENTLLIIYYADHGTLIEAQVAYCLQSKHHILDRPLLDVQNSDRYA